MEIGADSSSESLYDVLDQRRSPPSSDGSDAECARAPLHPARYSFAQAFGERAGDPACHFDVQDADMISAVRFNAAADMVATGDRGGRIVLLRRVRGAGPASTPRRRRAGPSDADADADADPNVDPNVDPGRRRAPRDPPEFRFWTQFQSHESEFDYLKSIEIEERINEIRWCRASNGAQRLLATNDKTIKLWRVSEKDLKEVVSITPRGAEAHAGRPTSTTPPGGTPPGGIPWGFGACMPNMYTQSECNKDSASSPTSPQSPREASFRELRSKYAKTDASNLVLPKVSRRGSVISATPRRVYSNSHAYHINSIALSSDEETFLSADDLRVNVWNLHKGGAGFNVVDIKPRNMEDLTEVITCAEFHPEHCHIFMHASSRGNVKLCDLRQTALCDSSAMLFEEPSDRASRSSFFSEIIASISDIKFSPDGRYILTRDYMTLRLWDVNMDRHPVLVVPVHEHLRARLGDIYENDCIFDKFHCAFSHDGASLLTGSYKSLFQSFSAYHGSGVAVEATVDFVSGLSGRGRLYANGSPRALPTRGGTVSEFADPTRKIMQLDAAVSEPLAAVAAGPALYLYYVS